MTLRDVRAGLLLLAMAALTIAIAQVLRSNLRFCFQDAVLAHPDSVAPRQTVKVLGKLQHDRNAFTQGLVVRGNVLWESTGLEGDSRLRRIDAGSGNVLTEQALHRQVFAEGLALEGERLHVLTWNNGVAFVHDSKTLAPIRNYAIPRPAWGLVFDGRRMIMSDGSNLLRYFAPASGMQTARLDVHDDKRPVHNLNELEIVGGEIWANVWHTDSIARIRPEDGLVTGWIDLEGCACRPWWRRAADTLNGIAHEPVTNALYLTGKRWPFILKVELTDKTLP